MALSIDEANAVSTPNYDTPLKQQVYQESPFYVKLQKKNKIKLDGGENIRFPIRYLEYGKADAVGPRQQVTFEQLETRTAGQLEWKFYNSQTMISWDERVKNTGKQAVVKLLAEKADELRQDMDNRFATDLYTANPNGLGFSSLATIVDSADTYAGIAVSDAATWKSYNEDAATTILAMYGTGSLAEAIADCTFGKSYPNFHLTTIDLASKFESLIEPQKRYEDKEMADAGFRNCTFHGSPVFGDYHCTAKAWYGLCIDEFEIAVHPDYDMDVSAWKELFQGGFPNAMAKVVSWSGNILCKCRRVNFKKTALDYTL